MKKIQNFYPVLATADVKEASSFYERHFGFRRAFDSDWYVHLQHAEQAEVNLAILDANHESVPVGHRKTAQGVLINFELEEVDSAYAALVEAGVEILLELRDEAWGQRHFIAKGPDGVLIDVIKQIPPSKEFVAGYQP